MDVFFPDSVGRNGVDSGYFDLLGIGEGKSKAKKLLVSVNADLAARFPPADTAAQQDVLILQIQKELDGIKAERAKAKSKKNKNTLDARIKSYENFLVDIKKYRDEIASLERQEAERLAAEAAAAEAAAAAAKAAAEAEAERLRIIQKGAETPPIIVDQSEVVVTELPTTTQKEPGTPTLTQTTQGDNILGSIKKAVTSITGGGAAAKPAGGAAPAADGKKSNTLIWVGVGALVLVGFLLMRKRGSK